MIQRTIVVTVENCSDCDQSFFMSTYANNTVLLPYLHKNVGHIDTYIPIVIKVRKNKVGERILLSHGS